MGQISISKNRTKFQEDIATSGGGTNLVSSACVVWNLEVSRENTGVAVVSFSDSTTYQNANKSKEIVLDGPGTHSVAFPKGWSLENGLSAISNLASVDISINYD